MLSFVVYLSYCLASFECLQVEIKAFMRLSINYGQNASPSIMVHDTFGVYGTNLTQEQIKSYDTLLFANINHSWWYCMMVMLFVKGLLFHDLKVLGLLDTNLVKYLTFGFKIIASHHIGFAPVLRMNR